MENQQIFWGRFPLFFALLSLFLFTSCSQPEASTIDTPVVSTQPNSLPTIVPSPTFPSEDEQDRDGAAFSSDSPTAIPAATSTLEESAEPLVTSPATVVPTKIPYAINGMSAEQFIVMSDETKENIRQIYDMGRELGRNENIFAILGDSLIATPQSLAKWDEDDYILGDFEYLKPTLDHYQGSYSRYGASVRVGLHSWSVFDPLWADKEICQANEDLLSCEIRLNNPSVMIVFLGSNDAGSPGGFRVNYRQIVEELIGQGIVPILATKADRFEGPDNVNNEIIRAIASEFQLPLLEFDILADTLPGRGLSTDNVHLTYLEPLDYTNLEILSMGYPVHNLASLMIIDAVRRELE